MIQSEDVLKALSPFDPQVKGDNALILCPWHDDSNPSLRVYIGGSNKDIPIGFAICFSCGAKGLWRKLAEKLGIDASGQTSTLHRPAMGARFTADSPNATKVVVKPPPISIPWPVNESWRGIDGSLVHRVGGRKFYDKRLGSVQLSLPVRIGGELTGLVAAKLRKPKSKKIPSYVYSKGHWIRDALFPYDFIAKRARKRGYVAVVEGSRDVLHLIENGMPALALLATYAADAEAKIRLLRELGVKMVLIATDADAAGSKAANKLRKALSGVIPVFRLRMKKGTDPFDLEPAQIKSIDKACRKRVRLLNDREREQEIEARRYASRKRRASSEFRRSGH